jgi:hypothetical protein
MTTAEIKEIADSLARLYPGEWSKCYPRLYLDTGDNYVCSKALPAYLLSSVYMRDNGLIGEQAHADSVALREAMLPRLQAYRMPTYYISRTLLEAVLQSDLPEGTTWDSLSLPMPAGTIMLPRGVVSHPLKGDVGFICYASLPPAIGISKENLFLLFFSCPDQAQTISFNSSYLLLQPGEEVNSRAFDDFAAAAKNTMNVSYNEYFWSDEEKEKLASFSAHVGNLLFRILLVMQACPKLLSKGQHTGKRNKRGREIWTPNIIGKDYAIKRSGPTSEGSGGWNVRMHWRRGHLRQQPHGPNNSLRKTIWVEPMLVGAEAQEHASMAAC